MAQLIADRKDVDFVLHDQLKVSELSRYPSFKEFNKKTMDLIMHEARGLAVKEILPTYPIGDQIGCGFEKGRVTTPEEFKRVWRLLQEGEWFATSRDLVWGGQGMPEALTAATRDYLIGANMALYNYIGLTHGAARLIEIFGSEAQKATYLKKMYTGEWSGTMLLTEPEAGSDLGALTTTAVKNPDGTFLLTGNKIFISCGEHDLTENIIHPVLARIEGAPEGVRGISLFLVPKYHVNGDGTLGAHNDIVCTGIEKKMGIHGNPTCSMSLGGKGQCIGTLLGEENKGLAAMFVMMNEERLYVGSQSLALASTAYLYALNYARNRIQGSALGSKDPKRVTIINHPDVRRMLMTMKTYVEGMRSLLFYVANCEDKKHLAETSEEKEKFQNLIDVLIPVCKGYVSDRAVEICSIGIQVFGGYGYMSEYPMEQLMRDVRICPIYEGTNGIQAMDLLGRKLGMKKGRLFMDMIAEIQKTLTEARTLESLKSMADTLEHTLSKFGELAMNMGKIAMSPEIQKAFANASMFLDATGDVVMAWMLLWRATLAANKLSNVAEKKDVAFLEGQLKSAQYFFETVLPVTHGRMAALMHPSGAAMEIAEESFGGM